MKGVTAGKINHSKLLKVLHEFAAADSNYCMLNALFFLLTIMSKYEIPLNFLLLCYANNTSHYVGLTHFIKQI